MSSWSRARAEALRIFRRMAARAGEAASAISSSLIIEVNIFSSRYLLGVSTEKRSERAVLMPADLSCQLCRERMERSVPATSRSSLMPRLPPACARRRGLLTFFRSLKLGPPNLDISTKAASVSSRSSRASPALFTGSIERTASAASSQVVSAATRSSILSSSKAL